MGEILRVNSIYPTIQGEGRLTGTPMVIVRTQGCSVGCSWCDTKETWNPTRGRALSVEALVNEVVAVTSGHRWVLLTGGEPLQQDCFDHVGALRRVGYRVALETSGDCVGGNVITNCNWFCLSPKGSFQDKCRVVANEVKFVVATLRDVEAAVDTMNDPRWTASPSLQPVWGSREALQVCIREAQRLGWRLSLQSHKLAGIP